MLELVAKVSKPVHQTKPLDSDKCQAYLDVVVAVFQYLRGGSIWGMELKHCQQKSAPSVSEFCAYVVKNPNAVASAFARHQPQQYNAIAVATFDPYAQMETISSALNIDKTYRALMGNKRPVNKISIGPPNIWNCVAGSSSEQSDFIVRAENIAWIRHTGGNLAVLPRPISTSSTFSLHPTSSENNTSQHQYVLSTGRTLAVNTDVNVAHGLTKPIEIERHPRHRLQATNSKNEQIWRRQKRVATLVFREKTVGRILTQNRFAPLETLVETDIAELPSPHLQASDDMTEVLIYLNNAECRRQIRRPKAPKRNAKRAVGTCASERKRNKPSQAQQSDHVPKRRTINQRMTKTSAQRLVSLHINEQLILQTSKRTGRTTGFKSIGQMASRTRIVGSGKRRLFDTVFLKSIGCVDAVDYWVRLVADGHDSLVSTMRLALERYIKQEIAKITDFDMLIAEIGVKTERQPGILRCLFPNVKERNADNVLISHFTYRVLSELNYEDRQSKKVRFADSDMLEIVDACKQYVTDPTAGMCSYSGFFAATARQEAANIDTLFARTAEDIARYYASMVRKDDRQSVTYWIQNGNVDSIPPSIRDKCTAAISVMRGVLNWTDGTATEHIKAMKKRQDSGQRLLVLRLWLQRQITSDSPKSFEFTVFPRPAGPLRPPITLCVEHQCSVTLFRNFAKCLEFYAKNVASNSDSEKLTLSKSIASRVAELPHNLNQRVPFLVDRVAKIGIKLDSLKPKKPEQLAHKHKQALGAFVNFLPHQAIHFRGELVDAKSGGTYRCQKSQFNPFRSWAMSGTRGDLIFAKGSIAKHAERTDNGIVDTLEEILAYANRSDCLNDLPLPPFLYACLVAPFPIAHAAISTLGVEGVLYNTISRKLHEQITSLISAAKTAEIDGALDEKYLCKPADRQNRIEWTMEAWETFLSDPQSEKDYLDSVQGVIEGTE